MRYVQTKPSMATRFVQARFGWRNMQIYESDNRPLFLEGIGVILRCKVYRTYPWSRLFTSQTKSTRNWLVGNAYHKFDTCALPRAMGSETIPLGFYRQRPRSCAWFCRVVIIIATRCRVSIHVGRSSAWNMNVWKTQRPHLNLAKSLILVAIGDLRARSSQRKSFPEGDKQWLSDHRQHQDNLPQSHTSCQRQRTTVWKRIK